MLLVLFLNLFLTMLTETEVVGSTFVKSQFAEKYQASNCSNVCCMSQLQASGFFVRYLHNPLETSTHKPRPSTLDPQTPRPTTHSS